MKIRIEIACDNAAFEHAPQHEIARILRKLSGSLNDHGLELLARGGDCKLRDVNGNTVGKAEIIEDRPVHERKTV